MKENLKSKTENLLKRDLMHSRDCHLQYPFQCQVKWKPFHILRGYFDPFMKNLQFLSFQQEKTTLFHPLKQEF